ncbi:bifunctional hydroxymethylpyrimidine kinase/phosphomethylpyrimidine kinase [Butyrivibrio sp. CB08]|uniref:bifunctional hydroxymethylpyrimidine kinase/phosphomethylpyrimidine kinase n=1 Tax=Butyrivibrio sp. CB08 TaxID=2364879 RepID=UPI000EA9AB57|nr:bifunctional hydroxymethylpyrimidine kinase/phosphomethylpyrimidine kinase [Butyrivibrio sp. CB08]RKM60657.1 bifunctional hydroxymethylpyrimidine kinase/phosphomethylpyrimidine kinase [Butyrivibrio sp. CB08]
MKKVLTIAGSDPSGGAGIQADLKTMEAHGVYGMSVITALTAQNTMGVTGKFPVPADFVTEQLNSIYEDIIPDAVKIGMLPDAEVMRSVRDALVAHNQKNVVLDPVLSSTSGTNLSEEDAREVLKTALFPVCRLITPNIPEAEVLAGTAITSKEEMERAAKFLYETYGCGVLIKGGHSGFTGEKAEDCLCDDSSFAWFSDRRIDNPNTHGTGCTLSSAIACNLAEGLSLPEAVERAKAYLTKCIEKGLDLGKGRGPLEHRI